MASERDDYPLSSHYRKEVAQMGHPTDTEPCNGCSDPECPDCPYAASERV